MYKDISTDWYNQSYAEIHLNIHSTIISRLTNRGVSTKPLTVIVNIGIVKYRSLEVRRSLIKELVCAVEYDDMLICSINLNPCS